MALDWLETELKLMNVSMGRDETYLFDGVCFVIEFPAVASVQEVNGESVSISKPQQMAVRQQHFSASAL